MCEPATIAYAVVAAVAVIGGAVQYDASKKAQAYQEQVADQNKKVAEAQAVDAERLGQIEASERRLKTRLQLATQRAGFGAQNVEATGTALDILGDTAMFGEIDEERIRASAARRAWGFRMQGYDIEANKRLSAFQSKVERTGTILSTVGKLASAYPSGGFGGGGGMSSGGSSSYGGTAATINTGVQFGGYT